MIYVIVGTDVGARGDIRRKLLKKQLASELEWEHMTTEEIGILAATPSLLGDTQCYVLTDALSNTERGEEFLGLVAICLSSPHIFVFEENKLLKKQTTSLEKTNIAVHTIPEKKKEETFNIFGLANAFGTRDRKKMWILLTKAFRAGIQPENVVGVLHWKVRDMFSKPQKVYSKEELQELSQSLVVMYHDAHRGLGNLALQLERFILSLGK